MNFFYQFNAFLLNEVVICVERKKTVKYLISNDSFQWQLNILCRFLGG